MGDLPQALLDANYNEAQSMYYNREVTGDEIRRWFAQWCIGKMYYAMRDGVPCELISPPTDTARWVPLGWIINA